MRQIWPGLCGLCGLCQARMDGVRFLSPPFLSILVAYCRASMTTNVVAWLVTVKGRV